jgi:hypothetical protein
MAGHQRTADTPAGGGRRADTPAGGGQGGAILRMGIHTCLRYGRKRIRREPQRGGREDVSTRPEKLGSARFMGKYSEFKCQIPGAIRVVRQIMDPRTLTRPIFFWQLKPKPRNSRTAGFILTPRPLQLVVRGGACC